MPRESVVTAIYAVLGQFRNWQPVGYVVEDLNRLDEKASRRVYGYREAGGGLESCRIGESGCSPLRLSVAEYALALHKLLLRSREVHLTFFTPLTLLRLNACRVYYEEDVLAELRGLVTLLAGNLETEAYRLGGELGQVVSKVAQSLRALQGGGLAGATVQYSGAGKHGVTYPALRAVSELPIGKLYSYFVPVPARMTLSDADSGCLITHRGEIDDIEAVMKLWISGMLAASKPAEVILDTTHGVNYLTSLLDKSFWESLDTVPLGTGVETAPEGGVTRGGRLFIEVYNTDPVGRLAAEDISYKYHLISFSSYTSGRLERIAEAVSGALASLESISQRTGEPAPRLINLLKVVVKSFQHDVLLWGYIFAEKAFKELQRNLESLPSTRVVPRVEVDKSGSIVTVRHVLALEGEPHADPRRARAAALLGWLHGILEVLVRRWERLRKELRILGVNIEGEGVYTLDVCKARGEEGDSGGGGEWWEDAGEGGGRGLDIVEELSAALTLLRYGLKNDLRMWRPDHRCGERGLRHFVAHAGLSGDVVECVKQLNAEECSVYRESECREVYRVCVDPWGLSEYLRELRLLLGGTGGL